MHKWVRKCIKLRLKKKSKQAFSERHSWLRFSKHTSHIFLCLRLACVVVTMMLSCLLLSNTVLDLILKSAGMLFCLLSEKSGDLQENAPISFHFKHLEHDSCQPKPKCAANNSPVMFNRDSELIFTPWQAFTASRYAACFAPSSYSSLWYNDIFHL